MPKAPWSAVASATASSFGFQGGSFAVAPQELPVFFAPSKVTSFPRNLSCAKAGERESAVGARRRLAHTTVIPAQAGIYLTWAPAVAGVTTGLAGLAGPTGTSPLRRRSRHSRENCPARKRGERESTVGARRRLAPTTVIPAQAGIYPTRTPAFAGVTKVRPSFLWVGYKSVATRLKARANRAKSGPVNCPRHLSRRTAIRKYRSEGKGRRSPVQDGTGRTLIGSVDRPGHRQADGR